MRPMHDPNQYRPSLYSYQHDQLTQLVFCNQRSQGFKISFFSGNPVCFLYVYYGLWGRKIYECLFLDKLNKLVKLIKYFGFYNHTVQNKVSMFFKDACSRYRQNIRIVHESRISKYQDIIISGYLNIRISGYLNIRISGNQNIRISGYKNIRISEYQDI